MRRHPLPFLLTLLNLLACGGAPPPALSTLHSRLGLPSFSSSFETGTLRTYESPAGEWGDAFIGAGAFAHAAAAPAAHRGSFGYRFTDAEGSSAAGYGGDLRRVLDAGSDTFLRFWFRWSGNRQGNVHFLQLFDISGLRLSAVINGDGSNFFARTATETSPGGGPLSPDTWHLLEFEIRGVGTTQGEVIALADGQERFRVPYGDAQQHLTAEFLGEGWSDDGSFVGELDYDDYRAGFVPHASRLVVSAPAQTQVGACTPVSVQLEDSLNALPASAPYSMDVELRDNGAPRPLFSDPQCTAALTALTVPLEASTATAYVRFDTPGGANLEASHVDFLSTASALDVLPQVEQPETTAEVTDLPTSDPQVPMNLAVRCGMGDSSTGAGGCLALMALWLVSTRKRRAVRR